MAQKFSLQRLLWSISGAEIDILEKCRTDHKRFGAVGATIAMTSFIAFLSGTSAAWYFTQRGSDTTGNIGWAMAFGLVWATLIFCIDRSLVITLKKSPEQKSQFWWAIPLVSRAVLAIIIAFMVSIPLELVVFEDFIAEQEFFWNENKSNSLSTNSRANRESVKMQEHINENNKNIYRYEKQQSALEGEKSQLESQIATLRVKLNNPTTKEYVAARKVLRTTQTARSQANSRLSSLQNKLANASSLETSEINSQINNVKLQIRNHNAKIASCNSIIKSEIEKWNKPINEQIAELQDDVKVKEADILQKKADINNTQKQIADDTKRRTEYEQQRDTLIQQHDATVKEGNHFIQNFEILEYAVNRQDIVCTICNGKGKNDDNTCYICHGGGKIKSDLPTEWYFLWMIRLLFFIIELLPTVVKIVMPIGAYDRMVYAEEKDMENYLSSSIYMDRIRAMHDLEVKAHEEQLKAQNEAEAEIRQQLIDKLKNAQIEIAETAVKKWRETELKRIEEESIKKEKKLPTSSTFDKDKGYVI